MIHFYFCRMTVYTLFKVRERSLLRHTIFRPLPFLGRNVTCQFTFIQISFIKKHLLTNYEFMKMRFNKENTFLINFKLCECSSSDNYAAKIFCNLILVYYTNKKDKNKYSAI